jgi:hypothetical protein
MLKYDVKLDKNNSILKNRIFYKKEGRQFRIFYIMHTEARFHGTEIDNIHEGNPMLQVISICSNVWEQSKSIFTIVNVLADRSKPVTYEKCNCVMHDCLLNIFTQPIKTAISTANTKI